MEELKIGKNMKTKSIKDIQDQLDRIHYLFDSQYVGDWMAHPHWERAYSVYCRYHKNMARYLGYKAFCETKDDDLTIQVPASVYAIPGLYLRLGMKKNELYRSGNFLEGDNAFYVAVKGTKYVTLHYYTRIQGCCDESWSWPLDQAEQLVKVLNEYGGEVAKYKIPNLVKHQKSKPIQ